MSGWFKIEARRHPHPEGIITAGHDNQTARTVAYRENEPINERALLAMLRQIIANNRAGGWRKLKGRGGAASGPTEIAGVSSRPHRPTRGRP